MSIKLPLPFKDTPFGRLSDPRVELAVRGASGERTFRFLLDTGADFSMAPRMVANVVGLYWDDLRRVRVTGIEQAGLPARMGILPLRVGLVAVDVRCLFIDNPDALFVIGRADFLDRFILTIGQPGGRIVLEAVAG